ncbi:MAG: phage tail protein [Albidovulum sp.]|uniref:tail fiber protein n=1 Tax=Albidovulum sp. TaxID=1872424 RepID=UPI003CAAAD78
MFSAPPVGSVCPFAGQVDPVSGARNSIWANAACASTGATPANPADAPLNHLESQGWMLCDGRYLIVNAYPELHAVIGSLYGDRTTGSDVEFRIPDYRGLFLRGFDAGAGMDPDAKQRWDPTGNNTANVVGSLQCDAMQEHTHNYDVTQPAAISQQGSAAGTSTTSKPTGAPNSPARTTTETRSRNVAVNYIIKFR